LPRSPRGPHTCSVCHTRGNPGKGTNRKRALLSKPFAQAPGRRACIPAISGHNLGGQVPRLPCFCCPATWVTTLTPCPKGWRFCQLRHHPPHIPHPPNPDRPPDLCGQVFFATHRTNGSRAAWSAPRRWGAPAPMHAFSGAHEPCDYCPMTDPCLFSIPVKRHESARRGPANPYLRRPNPPSQKTGDLCPFSLVCWSPPPPAHTLHRFCGYARTSRPLTLFPPETASMPPKIPCSPHCSVTGPLPPNTGFPPPN